MRSLLVLILLAFCFVGYGQIINFPDPNFKNALVNTKCVDTDGDNIGDSDADLNNDGEIDEIEASKVLKLNVSYNLITNLDGINNFVNLKSLNCKTNRISVLNIQNLKLLTVLNCSENRLSYLDLQGLTALINVDCSSNYIVSLYLKELNNLSVLACWSNMLTKLDVQELFNLKSLYCHKNNILELNIAGLLNLIAINCSENKLNNLNVQGLINLAILNCAKNQIKTLEIEGLINLTDLHCNTNQIESLNVEGLINLINLYCSKNQIKSINLKKLKNLKVFVCSDNQFTSLDVSDLKRLGILHCERNEISTLNFQGLDSLFWINCSQNKLNFMDIQNKSYLYKFDCSGNQLFYLNIKGTQTVLNPNLKFDNNPELKYICCNESQITLYKQIIKDYNLSCEVNSYCTFIPGGKFYTIQGQNTFDENNNGCNSQDIKLSNFKFNITNGTASGTFISNSTGNYTIPVQEGTHTITPILAYPDHFEITPASLTVTFPSTSDTITQNFCITPKGIFRQTNITVIPLSPPARPGFDAKYKIIWENVGNQIESGTLNFTYDESRLDYISATQNADQVTDGIIKWNFTNLLPFEKREITVTLKVNRPTDTPAVIAGDKLYLTASILDNIFTLENTVVGSYDPNDKTCLQGDRVKPDMVGKYVNYLIRFENTGNYAAENVVIKDIIDTKTFDVSSLQITDASHEVYTRIEGNKVEFIFENIQLPFDDANNDGYVAFKIKTLPTLVLGDSLKNLADIYFDYNFPIRTNEAQTTIALPSFTQDIATEVNIYPNPVRDILYLESDENWSKAEIYDISGRILRSGSLYNQTIDVSGLDSGTYFIRLKDGEKVGVVKFVKM